MWFVAYHEGFQPLNTHEVYQPQVKKMARKGAEFAGLSVAITTPIVNGEVDYETLKRQVEFHVEAGTTCLCPVGTTGESPTLSHDEHERVIAEEVQAAAGRIKVMAGTGSNSTAEALRLTAWAAKEGADAALMVAPYYNCLLYTSPSPRDQA